jgi:chorismate dehydratase
MSKPCVAASSYLNTAPLCYSFIHGEQKDRCRFLSNAAPARCADLLAEGAADAALIPVIEYQRIAGLKAAPGACVASKGKVRSVVLASKVPIEQVRRVTVDESSRTSAALIRIILERFYGVIPVYVTAPPRIDQMLESSDAALIIGDPAMLIDRPALQVYDLAEEWRRQTGLPFVFAFWAVRGESLGQDWARHGIDFEGAKQEGLAHIDDIVAPYSTALALSEDDLRTYLTHNISFDLDQDCLSGLDLYYRLAHEIGLIAKPYEVVFLD